MAPSVKLTCITTPNIAVIKYWGKRDQCLVLPLNDSISITLGEELSTKTTVLITPHLKSTKLWLNGKECDLPPRLIACLTKLKEMARIKNSVDETLLSWNIHICSRNNFPTAAGLASSASGYACLAFTIAQIYKLDENISIAARIGSGSACRSVYGGFVKWCAGVLSDGSDSVAVPLKYPNLWNDLRALIIVVDDKKKIVGSTDGMERSVNTSELLKHRITHCVPNRVLKMEKAIINGDFEQFAEITMKDSNQFHAICADTYPPCTYINDVSHAIIRVVHIFNKVRGASEIAYTFDAGPNACLFVKKENAPMALALIEYVFSIKGKTSDFYKGLPLEKQSLPNDIMNELDIIHYETEPIKSIIYTTIGKGPRIISDSKEHLLDENGIPN